MNGRLKNHIYGILEENDNSLHVYGNAFLIGVIILNTLVLVLSTIESFQENFASLLFLIGVFCLVIFTIEYILRVWSADQNPRYPGKKGRALYIFSFFGLIDLVCVFSLYFTLIDIDLDFLKIFRLIRIFTVFKIERYLSIFEVFGNLFRSKKNDLIASLIIMLGLLLFCSVVIYFLEHEAQPEKFSSIPMAMWWSVITLTTVGYGDFYPITAAGRIFGGISSIVGIGIFALPTSILAVHFLEEVERNRKLKLEKSLAKKIVLHTDFCLSDGIHFTWALEKLQEVVSRELEERNEIWVKVLLPDHILYTQKGNADYLLFYEGRSHDIITFNAGGDNVARFEPLVGKITDALQDDLS